MWFLCSSGHYTRYKHIVGTYVTESNGNVKRPVGRPPKRKRGRKPLIDRTALDNDESSMEDMEHKSQALDDEASPRKKRKYRKKQLPPTEIKTRGVQLPSYSSAMYEKRPRRYAQFNPYFVPPHILPTPTAAPSKPAVSSGSPRKRGRPKKVQHVPLAMESMEQHMVDMLYSDQELVLYSDPRQWTIDQIASFVAKTDAAQYSEYLRHEVRCETNLTIFWLKPL